MKENTEKKQPLLEVSIIEPNGYYRETIYAHIYLGFRYQNPENELRYYSSWNYDGTIDFDYLQISCQIDSTTRDWDLEENYSYGWALEYRDGGCIDMHKAKRMYKTLSTVDKRYEAMTSKLGQPKSFGQYVGFIADCLKIKQIIFSENKYEQPRIISIFGGIYNLDEEVKRLRKGCLKKYA